jgi:hypothetical protein
MNDRTDFRISGLKDLESIAASVGLPVGPRIGRDQQKKEWYVLLEFLRGAIPARIFNLPIAVRNGQPPDEPDFVLTIDGVTEFVEITEATDEADQKEMTAFEESGKRVALLGHHGGRFSGGASRPELAWSSDVVDALKRKERKVIFRHSTAAARRHLIIYPNSNASILLSDDECEQEAICNLRDAIGRARALLAQITNGCLVHVLGKKHICSDIVGDTRILRRHDCP